MYPSPSVAVGLDVGTASAVATAGAIEGVVEGVATFRIGDHPRLLRAGATRAITMPRTAAAVLVPLL